MADAVRGAVEAVVEAIAERALLTPHRTIVVAAAVSEPTRPSFRSALEEAIGPVGWSVIPATPEGRTEARRLNRERDTAAHTSAFVVVLDGLADLRFFRHHAPDLAAFLDLTAEVRVEHPGPWASVADAIRALHLRRHLGLAVAGLTPNGTAPRQVPLSEVYLPLVDVGGLGASDKPHLILGHPGGGKTTFLRYLATQISSGEHALPVALLVPCADFAADRQRAIRPVEDFLVDWLSAQDVAGAAAIRGHFSEVALLWDGLDEVVDPRERLAVLREVKALHARQALPMSILTGRSLLVDEIRAEDARGLHVQFVRGPTDDEVDGYIARLLSAWSPELSDRERDDTRHELVQRVQDDPALGALSRTPMLLFFLVLLSQVDGRLPDQRTALYARLAEVLVERWARARSLSRARTGARSRSTRPGDAWRVLGPLAFTLLESGGIRLHRDQLYGELVRISVARGEDTLEAESRARSLLALLQQETALLLPHGDGQWSFVHPTVAEYFAGVELSRDSDRRSSFLEEPFKSDKHEILVFCVGQLGLRADDERLTELVDSLVDRSRSRGRYTSSHPALFAAILREEPGLDRRVERRVIDRLMEFWWVRSFWPYPGLRVRSEARDLLWEGVDRDYGPLLREQLERRFLPEPSWVRWDRLVANVRDGRQMTSLLAWTIPILVRYDLDWRPAFAAMTAHEDPLVRWAAWWGRWQSATPGERPAVREALELLEPGLPDLAGAAFPAHSPDEPKEQ